MALTSICEFVIRRKSMCQIVFLNENTFEISINEIKLKQTSVSFNINIEGMQNGYI